MTLINFGYRLMSLPFGILPRILAWVWMLVREMSVFRTEDIMSAL